MAESNKIKLLFITQKIHENDDDLSFTIQWIDEFIKQGVNVQVICLEKRDFDDHFPVYSLGKERGLKKWQWVINFYKYIFTLKYDKVFVHMNPEWSCLGSIFWKIMNKPFYLWYTHYTMTWYLRMTSWMVNKMFCATKQSLPQFNNSSKKIVTNHGIDLNYWNIEKVPELGDRNKYNLLSVHRLCRSKRLELAIQALKFLPERYNLTVYGREVEKDYVAELKLLVGELGLSSRVNFKGPVPTTELKEVYKDYRLMINMASETIDKTKLEAMYFGIYPITTKNNSLAIGLPKYIEHDSPQEIADFILEEKWKKYNLAYLRNIVKEKHSLKSLIKLLLKYINE
jgi:glycosyltransferase involved in cell wall biosynthesis